MPTSYPTGRDALSNPTGADYMDTVDHAAQHANINDAMEAVQARLPLTSEGSVPRGVLPGGYAETTTSQTAIGATAVDLTGLAVTVTVGAGRRIKITGHVLIFNDATTGRAQVHVFEGATLLGRIFDHTMAAGDILLGEASAIITPTAGAHTYKLSAAKATGAGVIDTNAAAGRPLWIVVEDIGAA